MKFEDLRAFVFLPAFFSCRTRLLLLLSEFRMPPHAHGGGDEEEEIIIVRTDGPPFVDLKAKQGKGFEIDYDKVCKYIGSGKVSGAVGTRCERERRSVSVARVTGRNASMGFSSCRLRSPTSCGTLKR